VSTAGRLGAFGAGRAFACRPGPGAERPQPYKPLIALLHRLLCGRIDDPDRAIVLVELLLEPAALRS
jgi:hypothetical protein